MTIATGVGTFVGNIFLEIPGEELHPFGDVLSWPDGSFDLYISSIPLPGRYTEIRFSKAVTSGYRALKAVTETPHSSFESVVGEVVISRDNTAAVSFFAIPSPFARLVF